MEELKEDFSNETTIDLIEKYRKTKNVKYRNQVIMNNIKLVYSAVQKYNKLQANGYAFDDFVNEGVFGLINAIDHFDFDRKVKFNSYAHWWILKSISDTIKIGTLELPQHRILIYKEYEKVRTEMVNRGEHPDIEVISKIINVSTKILIDTINKKDNVSLNFELSKGNKDTKGSNRGEFKVIDTVSSKQNNEDLIIEKLDLENMQNIIRNILSQQEQDVLKYRFGLDGSDIMTLGDLSKKMKISQEYVRIIQERSISKIQKALRRKNIINNSHNKTI